MPGHAVARSDVKNIALFDKYQCPHCSRLLKNAVQPLCGHWLCESCADELLSSSSPKCPRLDCQEDLKADPEEGAEYFPDRFVRREIEGLIVTCPHRQAECDWEDSLRKLEDHLRACKFVSNECPDCGVILTLDQMGSHRRICPKAMIKCPLADFGCSVKKPMLLDDLKKHIFDHGVEHLQQITEVLYLLRGKRTSLTTTVNTLDLDDETNATGQNFQSFGRSGDDVETDHAGPKVKAKGAPGEPTVKVRAVVSGSSVAFPDDGYSTGSSERSHLNVLALRDVSKQLKAEVDERLTAELRRKDEEIGALRSTITKLEKSMRTKHAEFEDRDFRLSLIENSNYDGSVIWKIPQFSQRMSDAQTGKYTSIFSLPFYTGKYGYKMCLRLYILGDGIGKNSHMSLFFVVMKGEFDNILRWPFTHKVTFKLINQTGGRDIIDTFQPDPMSSSFRKPKSDMNIASGCPRFVSHTDLKNNGFIADDTVFIKCFVDINTVRHP